MTFSVMAILLPLLAAPCFGLLGQPVSGAYFNVALSLLTFCFTLIIPYAPGIGLVHADHLGIIFGMLSGFVGLTTAIANVDFVRRARDLLSVRQWRVYHAVYQVLLGATLLGLYTDNIGLLWFAVEAATVAAVVGVGLTRTAAALAAAWKYLVLGGVGIGLALFGSLLVYLAAQPAFGPGLAGLSFVALEAGTAHLDGGLLSLAFVFLLLGYGTLAALAPLHGWLEDAYEEGPAPLSNCLGGLTMNVALLAILRFRHLVQVNFAAGGGAMRPGPFLLALGLVSLLAAAVLLWRKRDARRFFAVSAIQHSGIAVFAFGVGGAAAIFGGLLHMLLHTLIKSALFQALMRAALLRGDGAGHYGLANLQGLASSNKLLGWLLGLCVFALTGLPPSGLFSSEFIIIGQTVQRLPVLSIPLGVFLLVCAVAVIRVIGPLVFGPAPAGGKPAPGGAAIMFTWLHLLLMLLMAFAMPLALARAISGIAVSLQ